MSHVHTNTMLTCHAHVNTHCHMAHVDMSTQCSHVTHVTHVSTHCHVSHVYMSTQCSHIEPPAPQPHLSLPLELLLLKRDAENFLVGMVWPFPHSECHIPNLFRLNLLRKARTSTACEY